MSSALFKKSLDIVNGTIDKNESSLSTMDLMPQNFRMTKTIKKHGKKRKINELQQKTKLTVDEARKKMNTKTDFTEKNIQKLLLLSSNTLDDETMEKLVRRAHTGHYVIPEEKPIAVEESVFTEEDFKNLEKELFFED